MLDAHTTSHCCQWLLARFIAALGLVSLAVTPTQAAVFVFWLPLEVDAVNGSGVESGASRSQTSCPAETAMQPSDSPGLARSISGRWDHLSSPVRVRVNELLFPSNASSLDRYAALRDFLQTLPSSAHQAETRNQAVATPGPVALALFGWIQAELSPSSNAIATATRSSRPALEDGWQSALGWAQDLERQFEQLAQVDSHSVGNTATVPQAAKRNALATDDYLSDERYADESDYDNGYYDDYGYDSDRQDYRSDDYGYSEAGSYDEETDAYDEDGRYDDYSYEDSHYADEDNFYGESGRYNEDDGATSSSVAQASDETGQAAHADSPLADATSTIDAGDERPVLSSDWSPAGELVRPVLIRTADVLDSLSDVFANLSAKLSAAADSGPTNAAARPSANRSL